MKDYVLKNGLVFGAIQVAMLFVSYLIGIDFMLQTWWGVFQFLFYFKFEKNITKPII